MFAYGETFTRLRGTPTTDAYGSPILSWDAPDSLDIPDCGFNPGRSSEPVQDARNAVVTQPEVYAPTDADVLAGDRLVVRGVTFEVDGTPGDYRSPFTGWRPGLVIALKEVSG